MKKLLFASLLLLPVGAFAQSPGPSPAAVQQGLGATVMQLTQQLTQRNIDNAQLIAQVAQLQEELKSAQEKQKQAEKKAE